MGSGLLSKFFKKESNTEEEISQLLNEDEQRGDLEKTQREMISNIFEFDDICADDIMTHRTDIEAVEVSDSLEDAVELAVKTGFSRIPVYDDDLDDIKGMICVKDLLKFVGKEIGKNEKITDYLREPLFVPETIPCGKLFAQMTEKRVQMAIVVDEYGGTAGLVTLEDVVESIVGNIQDEYDDEDVEYSQLDEKTFTFEGVTEIEEVEKALSRNLPDGDYDTLAGFVISLLGYLPDGSEQAVVKYEDLTFTVLKVDDRRIELIKVEID